jgi:hypothetical protein
MTAAELEGALLDYWVARAEGLERPEVVCIVTSGGKERKWCQYVHHPYAPDDEGCWKDYKPSTNWAQGGPIIERECIELSNAGGAWRANKLDSRDAVFAGSTMLEAAMRTYVVSKLDDTMRNMSLSAIEVTGAEAEKRVYYRLRL